jgi:hypothetical protein
MYFFTPYMGSIGSTETSGKIYQCTLRKIKEEQRSYLHSGGSLESGITAVVHFRHYVDFNQDGLRKIKFLEPAARITKGSFNVLSLCAN